MGTHLLRADGMILDKILHSREAVGNGIGWLEVPAGDCLGHAPDASAHSVRGRRGWRQVAGKPASSTGISSDEEEFPQQPELSAHKAAP